MQVFFAYKDPCQHTAQVGQIVDSINRLIWPIVQCDFL